MIRRLTIWLFGGILVLAFLGALTVIGLLRTDFGHQRLLGFALPRLQAETGIIVKYQSVAGAWPNQLAFKGLVISDDKGVWLEAQTFALDWDPSKLLSNRIEIRFVAIDGGNFIREPVIRSSGPSTPSKGVTPPISISAVRLKRFHLGPSIIDQELMLDLDGGFSLLEGRKLNARIDADVDTPGDLSKFLQKLLGTGFRLKGTVDGNLHGPLAINGLALKTRDGRLSVSGKGGYDVASHATSADIAATADPTLAAVISSDFSTAKPISLKVLLSGPIRDLTIKAEAAFQDSHYAANAIPPFRVSVDLVRTRADIGGPFTVKFQDTQGKPQGSATGSLNYANSGRIKLDNLAIAYNGTTAKGSVNLETEPLAGDVWFDADIPELASLPLPVAAKGMLKTSGRLHFEKLSIAIEAQAISDHLIAEGVELKTLSAKASGTLDALTVQATSASIAHPAVGVVGDIDIAALVGIKGDTTTLRLDKLTAQLAGQPLKLVAPVTLTSAINRLSLEGLDVAWGDDGRFTGSAERAGDKLKAVLKISRFEPPQVPALISGTIDVDTRRAMPGTLDLRFVPTLSAKAKVTMDLAGKWDGKRLNLGAAFQGYGDDANIKRIEPLTLSMPLALAAGKGLSVSTEGPIQGRFVYTGPITPFVALAPLPEQTLKGDAAINLSVSGTLDSPVFGGTAALKDATYEHIAAGVLVDHLNFDGKVARSASGYVLSVDITASDGTKHAAGEVPIKATGVMTLGTGKPQIEASVALDKSRLVHSERVTGVASGKIDLMGTLPNLTATGALTLQSLEINIPDSMPSSVVDVKVVPVDAHGKPIAPEALPAEDRTPINIALDLSIDAPENVFIRGRGLDSEWAANLKIAGTDSAPTAAGTLMVKRGHFDFSSRRFTLTQGIVSFVPSHTTDPDLTIEARYTAPTSTVAIINVIGRASSPKITLTSDPPLAEEDIMSLVLFGKAAKELSAFEAVQTANALAQLSGKSLIPGMGGGGPGIMDRVRGTLGLDLLDVSLGVTGGVSVGKYVQKNIYVSAKQGLAGTPGSISVDVDVNKWLSVKTDVGQDSQSTVGVFWKRDY